MISDSKWIGRCVGEEKLKTENDRLEMAQYIACGWYEPLKDGLYKLTFKGYKGLKEIVYKNVNRRELEDTYGDVKNVCCVDDVIYDFEEIDINRDLKRRK